MPIELGEHDFRLDEVLVQPARLVITVDDEEHRVEPRVMDILVLLAERSGDTVGREELRDTLWNAYVSDDAIHRAIWKLRRGLAGRADLVETVSKRGYRLTVAPELLDERVSGAVLPTPAPPAPRPARRYTGLAVTTGLVIIVMWIAFRDVPTPAAPPAAIDAEFIPFSAMSGYETQPSVNMSRRQVAFANFPKEGPDAFQWDIWLRDLDDTTARPLTRTAEHEMAPALSPDGSRVAFVRLSEECGFFVLDIATGIETPVALGCGESRGPTDCCRVVGWRDEQRLLLTRRERADGPVRIYELDLATSATRTLTDPPAQSNGDVAFALSHGGDRLAVVRGRTAELMDLHVLELATGEWAQLTSAGYPISGVTWSASDRTLTFGWNRTGTYALWEISADGGPARAQRTVGMNAAGPTTVGSDLIYEEWKSEINLWEIDVASQAGTQLVRSTRWDWRGQRSPDGDRLAFVSNRVGQAEIWMIDADDAEPRQLTRLEGQLASPPRWSPDGAQLAVAAVGTGGLDLALVNPESGAVRWVVQDASDERAPVFSRDGKTLFFASNRSGAWEIWGQELATGIAERWTRDGGAAARPAATGGIWFIRRGRPGLWHQPDAAADPRLVDAEFDPSGPSDWATAGSESGEAIYLIRWDTEHVGWLSRFDPATAATSDLLNLEDETGIKELFADSGLWISPDAARVIVSSVDLSHSDLWLRRSRSRPE
jgi:Tol biopolymer transport system component/DNA-binding winged helix-turn-helix (wHTH) protein